MMRLQKFLAAVGITSRRQAEKLIEAGKIKVNGKITTELGTKVDEQHDTVEFEGKLLTLKSPQFYIALNKPTGYVCSTDRTQGKSILDLVKIKQRLYPVGRLDKDSSGLILLTNDGEFANQITHPRYRSSKEYFVVLDQDLRPEDIKKLERGMIISGKKLQPIKVIMSKNKSARIILHEGINRQIRRMLGRLGYNVVKLKRIRIGKLELGDLKEGGWREIRREEVI